MQQKGGAANASAPSPEADKATAANLAKLKDNPTAFAEAAKKAGLEDPARMKAVLDAAVEKGSGWFSPTYNTGTAAKIIEGAAKSGNDRIKTNAFNAGAAKLAETGDPGLKATLANLVANDKNNAIAKGLDENGKKAFVDASFDALKNGNAGTVLKGLNAEQRADVARRLQMLPYDERISTYANITSTADGKQLAALIQANPSLAEPTYSVDGSKATPSQFVSAIKENASPQMKLDFIKDLAETGQIQQPKQQNLYLGTAIAHTNHNAGAEAAGQMLSTLNGDDFTNAVKSLSPEQLSAVMNSSVHFYRIRGAYGGVFPNADMSLTRDIVSAAATSRDADVKARVFIAATQALSFAPEGGTLPKGKTKPVTDALTKVLDSDTTGIVTALTQPKNRTDGLSALRTYLREKVENKEYGDIGRFITKLRRGNNLQNNPEDFLDREVKDLNGKPYYLNQRNLGYFTGSVAAAVNAVASSEKEQAAIAANIAVTVLWAGTAHHPADWQALAASGSGIANDIARQWTNRITEKYGRWKDHFYDLAYAGDPSIGQFSSPLASEDAFNAAAAMGELRGN